MIEVALSQSGSLYSRENVVQGEGIVRFWKSGAER